MFANNMVSGRVPSQKEFTFHQLLFIAIYCCLEVNTEHAFF